MTIPNIKIGVRMSEALMEKLREQRLGSSFPSRIYISDDEIRKGLGVIKSKLSGHYLPSDGHLEDIVRTILQNNKADIRDENIKDPYQYEPKEKTN